MGRLKTWFGSILVRSFFLLHPTRSTSLKIIQLRVSLHSGRELCMWEENDVNATNRGIVINMPSIGQVIVGWYDFKLFRTIPLNQLNLPVYDDFGVPERLYGRVETRDG
ncbi:MAG TPA: hypothetical protein H9796_02655 [Candidatus Butyricimonas faecavium]|nr:hypothetical protein [Candidatus Butyricimonas faecavium]